LSPNLRPRNDIMKSDYYGEVEKKLLEVLDTKQLRDSRPLARLVC
jgi:hypothetical protein